MLAHLAAVLLLFAPLQVRPWEEDLKAAKKEAQEHNRLIWMIVTNQNDSFTRPMEEQLGGEVLQKVIKTISTFSKPGDKTRMELWDYQEHVFGRIIGPFTPEFVSQWVKESERVWHKHDALMFRSKNRPSDQTLVDLALSLASRGEPDSALALLKRLTDVRNVEHADLALAVTAMAYEWANSKKRALDSYDLLVTRTRDNGYKSMALCGQGRLLSDDNRDLAVAAFRRVTQVPDSPQVFRTYAEEKIRALGG